MGLFGGKSKKEEVKRNLAPPVPELPELPRLPELPPMHEHAYEGEQLPQLPTFPNNSLGNKFSQNTIKEAVSGKRESDEVFDAEDFHEEERKGMMHKPLIKPLTGDFKNYEPSITSKPLQRSFSQSYDENGILQSPYRREEYHKEEDEEEEKPIPPPPRTKTKEVTQEYAIRSYMTKKAEPVFIRIDKFEESLKIFQEIKSQVLDIEEMIKHTKAIKAKEEEEILSWETEIQAIKNQIEKVDKDIFSRIE